MEEIVTVGLDLSLTGTGICQKRGEIFDIRTIKTNPKTCKNKLARLIYIRDTIMDLIPNDITMIAIEDFFTPMSAAQAGSAISLAMLGTAVRLAVYEKNIPFIVVSPNSLKKHVLGKGNGDKDMVVREVYKRYNLDVADNNQSDAVVLSSIAEHFYQVYNKIPVELPKYQQEVIDTLIEAKEDRGYNL